MRGALTAAAAVTLALCACGGRDTNDSFRPVDPDAAVFWDRQTTDTAELLQQMVEEFNARHEGVPIKVERAGGYEEIERKVTASLRAGVVPALAVGYPNTTMEYIRANAVAAFDNFIHDPELGLTQADRDDFYPAAIEMNVYPQFGGKMYSFPFAKSVLMMYVNHKVLRDAGLAQPPATWDEFLAQCRQIKERTGKYAYAVDVDCSTFDGMVFSRGGEVYRDGATLFDSPEAVEVFELYEALGREKLAYQIAGGFDDQVALTQDEVAFAFRSSSGSIYVDQVMNGRTDDWGMTQIPQSDPARPATVLYGPNFVLFNTAPEQQRAAWAFVKFFTTTEMSVRWARGTGYLPIRRSAVAHADLKKHWEEKAYLKATFDCLPFARSEPNVAGWQDVRELVERAMADVLAGRAGAREAAALLKDRADDALRKRG